MAIPGRIAITRPTLVLENATLGGRVLNVYRISHSDIITLRMVGTDSIWKTINKTSPDQLSVEKVKYL